MAMKYVKRVSTVVEAVKWFPKRETQLGAYDVSGVEYTDEGWYFADLPIQPGDYIVKEPSGIKYSMSEAEFEADWIPCPEN